MPPVKHNSFNITYFSLCVSPLLFGSLLYPPHSPFFSPLPALLQTEEKNPHVTYTDLKKSHKSPISTSELGILTKKHVGEGERNKYETERMQR